MQMWRGLMQPEKILSKFYFIVFRSFPIYDLSLNQNVCRGNKRKVCKKPTDFHTDDTIARLWGAL